MDTNPEAEIEHRREMVIELQSTLYMPLISSQTTNVNVYVGKLMLQLCIHI